MNDLGRVLLRVGEAVETGRAENPIGVVVRCSEGAVESESFLTGLAEESTDRVREVGSELEDFVPIRGVEIDLVCIPGIAIPPRAGKLPTPAAGPPKPFAT
jgi:hypothetical protein